MLIVVFLILLAVTGGAAAGAGWTLHARGPLSGWLGDRLPPWLIKWLMRLGEFFDGGETKRPASPPPAAPKTLAPRPGPRPLPDPPAPAGGPVLNGGPVPPDHAAAHARIAAFEPETDAELLAFYGGETAAFAGYGQAWADHADRLLHEIGLDPAFTHVAAQLADEVGDLSHAFAIVGQRLNQVYGAVQREIAENDLVLPYDARNWLTGEGFA